MSRRQSMYPATDSDTLNRRRLAEIDRRRSKAVPEATRAHLTALRNKGVYLTGQDDESDSDTNEPNNGPMGNSTRTKVIFENSYRILPEPSTRFRVGQARDVIETVMAHQLEEFQVTSYEVEKARKLSLHIANMARKAVRHSLVIPRYKIVAFVLVGQNSGQSVSLASRCLWFNETDNSVQVQTKAGDLYAVCIMFAVYYE